MTRWSIALLGVAILAAAPVRAQKLVDLNSASREEIESLPGIGEKMADEIINHRPFGKIDDLLQIPRFGEKRLAQIRDLVAISNGDTPSDSEDDTDEAPRAESPPAHAQAAGWHTPPGMTRQVCWRCREQFCVESGTESGSCPYCGVRWAHKGSAP